METVVWLVLVPLVAVGMAVWLYRIPDCGLVPASLRRLFRQVHGDYRRFLRGQGWEPGESELHRMTILGASVYAVDGHSWIMKRATCVTTTRQLVVRDADGRKLAIPFTSLRSVRTSRSFEPGAGSTYSVILERVDSAVHLPEGDVRLLCAGPQQCFAVETAIESVMSTPLPTGFSATT